MLIKLGCVYLPSCSSLFSFVGFVSFSLVHLWFVASLTWICNVDFLSGWLDLLLRVWWYMLDSSTSASMKMMQHWAKELQQCVWRCSAAHIKQCFDTTQKQAHLLYVHRCTGKHRFSQKATSLWRDKKSFSHSNHQKGIIFNRKHSTF